MPKGWRKQQSQDPFFRKAKQEGLRARSAYKLEEINARFHILKPGAVVLDLGAAPGSWSQVAARIVGKEGKVVAVDLQPMSAIFGVQIIQGDILGPQTLSELDGALPGGADVVLSDVSPRISGVKLTDHVRSVELATASLDIARRFLHPGGSFVVKVFQGEDFPSFVARAREYFESVKIVRPEASREESNEHYVVGLHLKRTASPES